MTTQHTPGPWMLNDGIIISKAMPVVKFGKNNEFERAYIVCQPNLYVDSEWYGEEMCANSRLISAAPELLEALKQCRDLLTYLEPEVNGGSSPDGALTKARAAIAKATGESQ